MDMSRISRISFDDMEAVYIIDEEGRVGFSIIPKGEMRVGFEKGHVDPMVQLSVTSDSSALGFVAGETRHNSGLTMSLKYVSQSVTNENGNKKVVTLLQNDKGIVAQHIVLGLSGSRSVVINTVITNNSEEDIMIEAVSSYDLSAITPYAEDEGTGRLTIHRFRSRWSAEGRHIEQSAEDLMLEPSWARFGMRVEKFGTIGSMPIKGFFPVCLVEDKEEGVVWGITNSCSSSWQTEIIRNDENLCISGGLADYEFGHFRKILKKGESFETPEGFITVVRGGWEEACDRMLDVSRVRLLENQKRTYLPAIFNEYCTTWGEPSESKIRDMLSVIKGSDFEYFVIDAGWYADSVKGWQDNMGDWVVADDLFPNGIKKVVDMIKEAGMKAGIWFELEVVGKDSDHVDDTAHLLTRDGKVIVSGTRRFWDMRSKWVEEYLTNRVIDFLNENGFEYIKIDYNDTIGMGCDLAESPGEGLRQVVNATKKFFAKIRKCVPGIAIEVCSSGGHRLESGFMQLADYLSFSDAHEEKEIPVIAADLHRLILPSKSQIWAVLRKSDSLSRITYSVCAGMYGVLCISGDVFDLSEEYMKHALAGVTFYKKVSPVIACGVTRRFGQFQDSNRALSGYQGSVRYGKGGQALVIVHSFKHEGLQEICIPLEGDYTVADKYEAGNHGIAIAGREIKMKFKESFDAVAVFIQRLYE